MKLLQKLMFFVSLLLVPTLVVAQGTISGTVTDAQSGDMLPGANVIVVGTSFGAATNGNGEYEITNIPAGSYDVKVSFIGYQVATQQATVTANAVATVDFALEQVALITEGVMISASRADRETPVAFTDVKKEEIENQLGSRDIPMVLNTTPSVYATQQGGGAGDARINVRGFNQRNVAIMINGVPVNDMENGWVYWSNWDGVGDATASIQMQRGLSAVNLATPSIGGTMNVITDPTALDAGGLFKQELGNDSFLKSTLNVNSGLVNEDFAFSATAVRKIGDGLIDKTWTDAWAYYFGGSYNINENNRLELYAVGAPQRHGQNLYKQNIGVYDADFARDLDGYDPAALDRYYEVGRKYNQTWGSVSPSYTGQQYLGNDTGDRYADDFINERENFYHKPQVNLNWFSKFTDQLGLYSIVYYSGGNGGGTGTFGSVVWDYDSFPSRTADWDATIARNRSNEDGSASGILRNSRNNQWTIGAISKLNYKMNDNLQFTTGLDWRTAEIEHYREVRDLLGGNYFTYTGNDFDKTTAAQQKGLGDRVVYNNTNTVDWVGGFLQAEYTEGQISSYGTVGYSGIRYTYTDHFTETAAGEELLTEADWIAGFQLKGGASYRLNETTDVFGNVGWVSKVPIFDNVIDDSDGSKSASPEDEKFASYEAGMNFHGLLENTLTLKTNVYYTTWKDRAQTKYVAQLDGSGDLVFLTGMDLLHSGLELEAAYQPIKMVRFDAAASFGNWKHTNDVSGTYKQITDDGQVSVPYSFYVNDLKVGDSPQTQVAISGTVYPINGLSVQAVVKNYLNNYADWDPFSRTTQGDRIESWKAPGYSSVDFHAYYKLPVSYAGVGVQVFGHLFNALDATYVQDAVDNSSFNAFDDDHDADDAEVYLGIPRNFNLGLKLTF